MDTNSIAQIFLDGVIQDLANHRIHQALFLNHFRSRKLSLTQLKAFAVQWFKTTRSHKLAFPGLIANVTDDDTRFELVGILYEEYGSGDRGQIHAFLLDKFLRAVGVSYAEAEMTPAVHEVAMFAETLADVWKNGDQVIALGLHFSLEHLASTLMPTIAEGLRQYPELSHDDKEYFIFHSAVETVHAHHANSGVLRYASQSEENRIKLARGINNGIWLMQDLYKGFHRCISDDQTLSA